MAKYEYLSAKFLKNLNFKKFKQVKKRKMNSQSQKMREKWEVEELTYI